MFYRQMKRKEAKAKRRATAITPRGFGKTRSLCVSLLRALGA
jgi:hypothetical protein